MRHAFATDQVAVAQAMVGEVVDVLHRPRLARFFHPGLRDDVLPLVNTEGAVFAPTEQVTDCRDPKDNFYLEFALASGATIVVSSDGDLLALHPWRGVRILRQADYMMEAGHDA